ncbi:transcriptional activator of glycolytic enzymes-domain-containing protein [Xylaria nigripes]|nr:transcriptional activator of glycolytic enzymes-domain-containing protein [Xylaria nigripes]
MLPQLSSSSQVTSSIAAPSNVAASTTAPIPVPTSTTVVGGAAAAAPPANTATPTPGPAALTGAIAPKRPAASDLQHIAGISATSSKRQATGSGIRSGSFNVRSIPIASDSTHIESPASSHSQLLSRPSPTMMPAPAVITEDQLHGRTSEQMIATILHLQNQHQQVVAHINAQYDHINQQLSDLRGSLIASHQAAASALSSRDLPTRSAVPPPPVVPQQTAVPPPSRPPTRTPTRTTPRAPPASPSRHLVPKSSVSASTPTTGFPPQYDYRTLATVEEVWKEYREGMDGQPAIEQLDATWGSRWRPEPRGRTWYSRRKVIWDKIREFTAEGMDEKAAVQEVEKLRDGGTINKLIRMLQDERKEKGTGDDASLLT